MVTKCWLSILCCWEAATHTLDLSFSEIWLKFMRSTLKRTWPTNKKVVFWRCDATTRNVFKLHHIFCVKVFCFKIFQNWFTRSRDIRDKMFLTCVTLYRHLQCINKILFRRILVIIIRVKMYKLNKLSRYSFYLFIHSAKLQMHEANNHWYYFRLL